MSLGYEPFFKGQVVLYYAVVHHGKPALAVVVRVGVNVGGPAVGGPAGVPYSCGGVKLFAFQPVSQGIQFSHLFVYLYPVILGKGDTR